MSADTNNQPPFAGNNRMSSHVFRNAEAGPETASGLILSRTMNNSGIKAVSAKDNQLESSSAQKTINAKSSLAMMS